MRPRIVAFLAEYLGSFASYVVPGYVFMLALGSVLAVIVTVDEGERLGHARRDVLTVLMVAYGGGLAGAAAVPFFQGLAALASTGRFAMPTGMAAYGGLIGGTLASTLAMRRMRIPALPMFDAAAPALALAYFFARLGCFLAGCDYGKPWHGPGAVQFPRGSHAHFNHVQRGWIAPDSALSLPVHATQLYASFTGLALYFVLRRIRLREDGRDDGRRFAAFVVLYAACRFALEALRGDASRGAVGPLSTSQAIAVGTVITAGAVALFLRARSRRRAGTLVGSA